MTKRCLHILAMALLLAFAASEGLKAQSLLPAIEGERREYSAQLGFRGNSISGVLILKREKQQTVGTLMNEFGIRAFDVIIDAESGKVRLQDVMPFIDKWYIKKIIKADLRQLVAYDKNPQAKLSQHREAYRDGSTLALTNNRYNISYRFTYIENDEKQ